MIEKVGEGLPLARLLYSPPSVNNEVMKFDDKTNWTKKGFSELVYVCWLIV